MTHDGKCCICVANATQKCSNCQNVFYCSKEHQKQDWKSHKTHCCPIKVKDDKILGRYLVATKDIKHGDIIHKEVPLITGPSQVTVPVCLSCYKPITHKNAKPCTRCGWPMCSDACQDSVQHEPECHYTTQRGEKVVIKTFGLPHPNYQCLMTLRCLYQRDHNPKLWSKLQALEAHTEHRRGTEKWNSDKTFVASFIHTFFQLKDVFSEEEIMKCVGIVQINGHEVPLSELGYVAVYDKVSLFEHNCRANCAKSFTSRGDVLISAGSSIAKGENLSICYTDPLWGTEARRHHLAETKFFNCCCLRCSDVTEFGTMYSGIKCQMKSCKGYLLPKSFLVPILMLSKTEEIKKDDKNSVLESDNETGTDLQKRNESSKNVCNSNGNADIKQQDDWICNSCDSHIKNDIIQNLLEGIGRDLTAMTKGSSDSCERFIEHCSRYLHPNHYYMTDVGLALAQIIGQEEQLRLVNISDERLQLKTELCSKLAELLGKLVPAEHRGRGSLLFELHAALAESGKRQAAINGPAAMIHYVTESRKVLAEAAFLLQHEPADMPEGQIAAQAEVNLREMDALLLRMSACVGGPS